MKSFLYAGAALMIGASIYGFVDYKTPATKRVQRHVCREEGRKTYCGDRRKVTTPIVEEKTEPGKR